MPIGEWIQLQINNPEVRLHHLQCKISQLLKGSFKSTYNLPLFWRSSPKDELMKKTLPKDELIKKNLHSFFGNAVEFRLK